MGTTMMGLNGLDLTLQVGVERELFGAQALVTKITGWFGGGVSVRRPSTPRLNAHGEFSERGWRGARVVSVEGEAWADNRADAARLVDDYAAYLADGTSGRITVVDPDQGTRTALCYLSGTPDLDWDTDEGFSFAFDLVCTDPRKYAVESVTAESGKPVPGGGLVFPLFSAGPGEQVATNLATNPNFGINADGWAGGGSSPATIALSTEQKFLGAQSLKVTATGTNEMGITYALSGLTIGEQYTLSGYVYIPAANGVPLVSSTVSNIGYGTNVTAKGTWTRSTYTITATGTTHVFGFNGRNAMTAGMGFYVDAVMIEQGGQATSPYFDGSTAPADGIYYEWEGAPHASPSRKMRMADGSGRLNFGQPGDDGTATLTNLGTADTTVSATVSGPAPEGFTITELETGRRLVYTGAVQAGQQVVIDGKAGTVLLEGYADRAPLLTIREWFTLPAKTSRKYRIDAPSGDPRQLLEAVPAWW